MPSSQAYMEFNANSCGLKEILNGYFMAAQS